MSKLEPPIGDGETFSGDFVEPKPMDPVIVDIDVDKIITPAKFAAAIDESDLITQLKDLQGQHDALIVPDPNQQERYEIILKMQAIRERLQKI